MQIRDDDLQHFAAHGAAPLPETERQGHVGHNGARIWYATYGQGKPVILLHGGLGHSGNWGYQVPALVDAGYQVIVIDSRGHGHSSRDGQPYGYSLMAGDVRAVMQALGLDKAAFVGWSDGACISLVLAAETPERVSGVFYFACNMDPTGVKEMEPSPLLDRCFSRHAKDYAALSATPDDFKPFVDAVTSMQQREPNFSAADLAAIDVPVAIVLGAHDEFIKPEHMAYLAATIPGATHTILAEVSHFAPLQRPDLFNKTVLSFLERL